MRKFIIGISGGVDGYYNVSPSDWRKIDFDHLNEEDIWRRTGKNLGNGIWAYGAYNLFNKDSVEFAEISLENINNKKIDMIALLLANLFKNSPRTELLAKSLYERLRDTEIPIIVLSAGAQHPTRESYPDLGPFCVKLLRLLSEKSMGIGVRGEYTKKVFIHYGVDERKIIKTGCPSILINLENNLGNKINKKYQRLRDSETQRLITSPPSYKPNHKLVQKLFKLAIESNGAINLQSEESLMLAVQAHASSQDLIKEYENIFGVNSCDESKLKTFREKIAWFNNIPHWINHIKSFDLGVSGRIHGGILMINSGLPTMIISIDSRVDEMCELFHIPHIKPKIFMSKSVADIFRENPMDGELFDINRKLIAHRYHSMISRVGAPINDRLISFMNE